MKKCLLIALLLGSPHAGVLAEGNSPPLPPPTPGIKAPETPPADPAAGVRSRALELAGAFSNDGFLIRDGFWSGELEPGRPQILEVNLFAGNAYWFSAAAESPARKISVTLFDENGAPVEFEPYADGAVAAAGFVAPVSSRHFVAVKMLEGEKAPFCLVYSYK